MQRERMASRRKRRPSKEQMRVGDNAMQRERMARRRMITRLAARRREKTACKGDKRVSRVKTLLAEERRWKKREKDWY